MFSAMPIHAASPRPAVVARHHSDWARRFLDHGEIGPPTSDWRNFAAVIAGFGIPMDARAMDRKSSKVAGSRVAGPFAAGGVAPQDARAALRQDVEQNIVVRAHAGGRHDRHDALEMKRLPIVGQHGRQPSAAGHAGIAPPRALIPFTVVKSCSVSKSQTIFPFAVE